ncbi:hypothetical protein ASC97_29855 [Rhizobium sp. Root1203]|uniref:hypothetical protein n=1 Tax=Rhizobium sp. Root1203 TaxID=1736427 RepID=UPI000709CF09|nr:hypothetical protein [Rhizobium sp. Root1203]KQV18264.1 hypothetical protein ASC97_29855 [Rhizobium sp. Root1203]
MTDRYRADYFRYFAGALLLGTHTVVITILFLSDRSPKIEDRIGIVLIAIPVTLAYVVAFLRFSTQHASADLNNEAETYNVLAVATMSSVIMVFCIALLLVSIGYTFFSFSEPQQFKLILGVVETAFGGLVGTIFEMLFGVRIETGSATGGASIKNSSAPDVH